MDTGPSDAGAHRAGPQSAGRHCAGPNDTRSRASLSGRAWVRLSAALVSLALLTGGMALVAPTTAAHAADHPRVYAGGGVIDFGDAANINAPPAAPLPSVMVTMAADPASTVASEGFWLASADGGVYPEGSAPNYGSVGNVALNAPIVGMAAMPNGKGYWLAAVDGGVFAFGDAAFYGSMGGHPLNQPIVGMASTANGKGYWLVAADGGIFAFGDAPFYGSTGNIVLNDPVTAMTAAPDGRGYMLVATDGGIFAFGSVGFYGSLGGGLDGDPHDVPPVAGMALTPDAHGYWLLEPDGWSYSFSSAGDPPASPARSTIVSVANSQVATDPDPGRFCNPYGPCEEWCSLFATWVWERAGVPIPEYPFTGDIYTWAAGNTGVLPPTAVPLPGDIVLYGTGPWSTATSLHAGVVVQVWPDGAVVTVEGDAGPAASGSLAVVINGPYLPSRSATYNGMPIYAFAQP